MMKDKKKRTKAYNPIKKINMNRIEVSVLLSPFYQFIHDLKNGFVWVREDTNSPVISDKGLSIEDMLKVGRNPALALPKFALLFEEYVQVLAYYFNLEEARCASENVLKIRYSIFDKIENDDEVNKSDILFTEQFINEIKTILLKISIAQFDKIKHEIGSLILNNTSEKIEAKELRVWLLQEKGTDTDLFLTHERN